MNRTANFRRLQNEIKQLKQQSDEYKEIFVIEMVGDDMYHWQAVLFGPKDSLYEKCQFDLDIKLPDNYPFSPIAVKFKTPIIHINVNANGDICLDILTNKWSPSQNIHSVLLSICLLLSQPNTDDPFNYELAEIYKQDKKKYLDTIRRANAKLRKGPVKKNDKVTGEED